VLERERLRPKCPVNCAFSMSPVLRELASVLGICGRHVTGNMNAGEWPAASLREGYIRWDFAGVNFVLREPNAIGAHVIRCRVLTSHARMPSVRRPASGKWLVSDDDA
jgi:hypothetical protein